MLLNFSQIIVNNVVFKSKDDRQIFLKVQTEIQPYSVVNTPYMTELTYMTYKETKRGGINETRSCVALTLLEETQV